MEEGMVAGMMTGLAVEGIFDTTEDLYNSFRSDTIVICDVIYIHHNHLFSCGFRRSKRKKK
jgi:hypothetical protein